jgi:hypothetical protein
MSARLRPPNDMPIRHRDDPALRAAELDQVDASSYQE